MIGIERLSKLRLATIHKLDAENQRLEAELNEAKRLAAYDTRFKEEMLLQREKTIQELRAQRDRLLDQLKGIKELCEQ